LSTIQFWSDQGVGVHQRQVVKDDTSLSFDNPAQPMYAPSITVPGAADDEDAVHNVLRHRMSATTVYCGR
jgi:hypothetical protein